TLGTQTTAVLTIIDNDVAQPGTIQFNSSAYSVNENGTVVTAITLTRTGGSDGAVSVTLTPSNGTATNPGDFNATPIAVNFANGETSKTVPVSIVNDTLFEGDETVNLTLSNATGGATLGSQTTAVLTIIDNDSAPVIQFNNSTYSVNENGVLVNQVTLIRSGGSNGGIAVTLTPSNGTATSPADFTATPIVVNFAEGENSKTVTIPIVDDALVEGNETVNLTLSNATGGAVLGTQTSAVLTIIDNDVAQPGTIQFNNSAYSVNENGTVINTITLTRTGGSDGAVSVRVTPSNGTATSPTDFNNAFITVNFANGETSKIVAVPIVDDALVEGNETVNLTLSNPAGGAVLGTPTTAVLTIVDNDFAQPGTIQFNNAAYSVNENGTVVTAITLTRTGGSDGAVGVTLTPSNGTATSPADFNAAPIVVNFANGETSKTVAVPIVDDTTVEGNETVNLTLSNPTGGAVLGTQTTALLTIVDNNSNGGGNTITGTEGNDRLSGTPNADIIDGLGGDDTLLGREGNDQIFGRDGNDTVQGNNGSDIIFGGAGRDRLSGDNGNDQLFGEAGNDALLGGNGNDLLVGGQGKDTLTGGAGVDTFNYQDLTDSLLTGFSGFDVINDFRANDDKFLVANLPSLFTPSAGKVAFLNESRIQAILTPSVFANPGDAALFTNGSNDRTFLSLNGATPGFQASEDAILELRNFALVGTITAGNFTLS
ncbi:MAG: hypothetical protein GC158_04900, partial [Cyanobacteria bacterium RI_101]|nr:hypothetical protein [Cyanobacteria bacterium RI_101]